MACKKIHNGTIDLSQFTGVTSIQIITGSEINGLILTPPSPTTGNYSFELFDIYFYLQFSYKVFAGTTDLGVFTETFQCKENITGDFKTGNQCGCKCDKQDIIKVCECVSRCTDKLIIQTGIISQQVTISIQKYSYVNTCKTFKVTTDNVGDAKIDIPFAFLFNSRFGKTKYIVSGKDVFGNQIVFEYKGLKGCALEMCLGSCDEDTTTNRLI